MVYDLKSRVFTIVIIRAFVTCWSLNYNEYEISLLPVLEILCSIRGFIWNWHVFRKFRQDTRELTIIRNTLCNCHRVWQQTYTTINGCSAFYIFHSHYQTGYD